MSIVLIENARKEFSRERGFWTRVRAGGQVVAGRILENI